MKKLFAAILLITGSYTVQATELTVYTYDSFVSEWGPGTQLKAAFEKQCGGCTLKYIAVEDGVSILNRLRIEGERTKADVIVGIDDALMEETRATGLVVEHGQTLPNFKADLNWHDKTFVPYDYGYFAFIYDSSKLDKPATSLKELVESKASIIYQDPRTSTPGQGLLLWMKAVYGDKAPEAWAKLAQHTTTVTKGWSEAYAMFLKGDADYVLSYNTSPAYHAVSENKTQYHAALFSEGHIAQIELAALVKTTQQPELAKQFLSFLVSEEAQTIIPVTNWMLPVIEGITLPPAFSTLIQPKTLHIAPAEVAQQRKAWLNEWRSAAAQ